MAQKYLFVAISFYRNIVSHVNKALVGKKNIFSSRSKYFLMVLTNQMFRRRVGRGFSSAFLSCTLDSLKNLMPVRFGG